MRETGVKLTPSTIIHNFAVCFFFFCKISVFFFAFLYGSAFAGHLLILLCVSPSGWHNTCTVYVCMHVQAARFISTHLNSSYFCQLAAILISLICILLILIAFLHTYFYKRCCVSQLVVSLGCGCRRAAIYLTILAT